MQKLCLTIVLSFMLLSGCASNNCRPPIGNPSVTPTVVSTTDTHLGQPTQWGGAVVETRHLKDSTELEVIAYPLDDCGQPNAGANQTGRFIIVYPGFLETTDYEPGSLVSATGRITGIRKGRLGDANYGFPLLESYKVRLWPEAQSNGAYSRPWVNIGIGGGSGGVFGGVGVIF